MAVFKFGIRTPEFFRDHDKLRSGIITENQFVCGLSLAVGKEAQLSRAEIQKIVEYYRDSEGRVKYKEFTDLMENGRLTYMNVQHSKVLKMIFCFYVLNCLNYHICYEENHINGFENMLLLTITRVLLRCTYKPHVFVTYSVIMFDFSFQYS